MQDLHETPPPPFFFLINKKKRSHCTTDQGSASQGSSHSKWKEILAMLNCDSKADKRHIYILIATLTSMPVGYIEMFTFSP